MQTRCSAYDESQLTKTSFSSIVITQRLKEHFGMTKDVQVAKLLDINPSILSNWHSRNTYNFVKLFDLSKEHSISLDWLIHGATECLQLANSTTSNHNDGYVVPIYKNILDYKRGHSLNALIPYDLLNAKSNIIVIGSQPYHESSISHNSLEAYIVNIEIQQQTQDNRIYLLSYNNGDILCFRNVYIDADGHFHTFDHSAKREGRDFIVTDTEKFLSSIAGIVIGSVSIKLL